LESELFGHEKGAFTGAGQRLSGKFELASGGTLFLDEVGTMSLSFQQKILRVVEYGTFTRVGGLREIQVQARIIAATNVDLEEKMAAGTFLRDLYDRLSFEVIFIPPLRERESDIGLLARYFLDLFIREIPTLRGKVLSEQAITALEQYHFPGNIRELKNIIERAAYRSEGQQIEVEDLGQSLQHSQFITGDTFHEKVDSFKKNQVLEAYRKARGNQAEAARNLGLAYHQYRYFYHKYKQP
ncbi:sigma 54-interacting transcriptional regulator, partial [candidate division CSSED10-310 bacterium]